MDNNSRPSASRNCSSPSSVNFDATLVFHRGSSQLSSISMSDLFVNPANSRPTLVFPLPGGPLQ
jgi:hypothetical protein